MRNQAAATTTAMCMMAATLDIKSCYQLISVAMRLALRIRDTAMMIMMAMRRLLGRARVAVGPASLGSRSDRITLSFGTPGRAATRRATPGEAGGGAGGWRAWRMRDGRRTLGREGTGMSKSTEMNGVGVKCVDCGDTAIHFTAVWPGHMRFAPAE